MMYYTYLESPLEPLLLVSDGEALTGIFMTNPQYGLPVEQDWIQDSSIAPIPQAKAQLEAYFAGTLQEFDLPLRPRGTPFQEQVWKALLSIPYGTTTSYAELARRIGRPGSVRAVGQANAHNPISIVVPCHRVIGADGSLTGYGGGLDRKSALLFFEAAVKAGGPRPLATLIPHPA